MACIETIPKGDGKRALDRTKVQHLVSRFKDDMELLTESIMSPAAQKHGMVTFFGSSRIKPGSEFYKIASETAFALGEDGYGICTGGGPGIMEAANKGALAAGAYSLGIQPSFLGEIEKRDIPEDSGMIHIAVNSMQSRKIVMSATKSAFVFFPGGLGTLDEFSECITMIQLGKIPLMPIICMGYEAYWKDILSWMEKQPLRRGFISERDLDMLFFADNAREAVEIMRSTRALTAYSYQKRIDPFRLAGKFEADLSAAVERIEQIEHPSATFFGSARTESGHPLYAIARALSKSVCDRGYAAYCGGGSGIMEAVIKGANDAKKPAVGFLPHFLLEREKPTGFELHDVGINLMASRKIILGNSDAHVFFPGGLGTLDEFFEYAVMMQLGIMEQVPMIVVKSDFWSGLLVDIKAKLAKDGYMNSNDLGNVKFVETPEEAARIL